MVAIDTAEGIKPWRGSRIKSASAPSDQSNCELMSENDLQTALWLQKDECRMLKAAVLQRRVLRSWKTGGISGVAVQSNLGLGRLDVLWLRGITSVWEMCVYVCVKRISVWKAEWRAYTQGKEVWCDRHLHLRVQQCVYKDNVLAPQSVNEFTGSALKSAWLLYC